MPRINLLPWREEDRKRRQREFLVAMAGSFVAGLLVVVVTILVFSQMISGQKERNQRLQAEIQLIEEKITAIDGLERQKERLIARMEIIEQLQQSRPEIVHLFDEMTRQLPDGVYLRGMKQTGTTVEVKGVAQSSTRVSALMRQIDASPWLTDPSVIRVETTESGPGRQAEFVVTLKQVQKNGENQGDNLGDEG